MAKISSYTDGGAPQSSDQFIVARGGSNVKLLYSAVYSAIQSALAALFAPIAKGVTNGDSHDHIGGDGAAIAEGALSLADVTTGDVSITKHGFAPKAPNDATKFLDGTGAWDTVKDSDLSTSDITTNNASTSKHGFSPKATAPAAGLLSVLGIGNGETVWADKTIFDNTNPAALGTAGPGTQVVAARRDHVHTLPKLDDAAAPDDNTDLDASTTKHGLSPKAVAPAAGLMNVLGIVNGETARSNKAIFDSTNPAALGTAAPGTQVIAARRDHVHAMPADTDLTGAAWTSFTPVWTNLTKGSGTNVGYYKQIGKTVFFHILFIMAADSSVSGSISVATPVAGIDLSQAHGMCFIQYNDASPVVAYPGVGLLSTSAITLRAFDASGTYLANAATSATVPFTWTTSDRIAIYGFYEAA